MLNNLPDNGKGSTYTKYTRKEVHKDFIRSLKSIQYKYNVWSTIINNSPTPRKEILINLNPPDSDYVGQAAIRSGNWKLITGMPNCKEHKGDLCPDGWVHDNGTIEEPPYTPSLMWLFNLELDLNERHSVVDKFPLKVKELMARIEFYSSTHIKQLDPPLDPRSNPENYNNVWTPWLN